jgi:hypothetical protein
MHSAFRFQRSSALWLLAICYWLLAPAPTPAFPPALPHTIVGMARDEYGNPLASHATIILTSASGVSISCKVTPGLDPGVNYRMVIPMDSGVHSDFYKASALQATAPFRLRVVIGNKEWLPIEMAGDQSLLGQPGKQTRIDLTLGEDANGNGLPDAWESAMIAARGWDVPLTGLDPNSSPGKNGVTLFQEYIAGSYGFEDSTGLDLRIVKLNEGMPVLEFMAVRGRNYSVLGSADFKTWSSVAFRPVAAGAGEALIENYLSSSVQLVQVAVPVAASQSGVRFFKLRIQ